MKRVVFMRDFIEPRINRIGQTHDLESPVVTQR
jgi:hypothetical protein